MYGAPTLTFWANSYVCFTCMIDIYTVFYQSDIERDISENSALPKPITFKRPERLLATYNYNHSRPGHFYGLNMWLCGIVWSLLYVDLLYCTCWAIVLNTIHRGDKNWLPTCILAECYFMCTLRLLLIAATNFSEMPDIAKSIIIHTLFRYHV